MAAQGHFAEPADDLDETHTPQPRKQAPRLANASLQPRPSPARQLQHELRRAFSPGPITVDRFSTRRALKFIAPTWLGMWAFIALVGRMGHH